MREDEDELTGLKREEDFVQVRRRVRRGREGRKIRDVRWHGRSSKRRRGDSETKREGVEVTDGWIGERLN